MCVHLFLLSKTMLVLKLWIARVGEPDHKHYVCPFLFFLDALNIISFGVWGDRITDLLLDFCVVVFPVFVLLFSVLWMNMSIGVCLDCFVVVACFGVYFGVFCVSIFSILSLSAEISLSSVVSWTGVGVLSWFYSVSEASEEDESSKWVLSSIDVFSSKVKYVWDKIQPCIYCKT